jgi:hypothetical protein
LIKNDNDVRNNGDDDDIAVDNNPINKNYL